MANKKIRQEARSHGVYLWEVAEKMGITDFKMSRKMRHELDPDETEHILQLIKTISEEKYNAERNNL